MLCAMKPLYMASFAAEETRSATCKRRILMDVGAALTGGIHVVRPGNFARINFAVVVEQLLEARIEKLLGEDTESQRDDGQRGSDARQVPVDSTSASLAMGKQSTSHLPSLEPPQETHTTPRTARGMVKERKVAQPRPCRVSPTRELVPLPLSDGGSNSHHEEGAAKRGE